MPAESTISVVVLLLEEKFSRVDGIAVSRNPSPKQEASVLGTDSRLEVDYTITTTVIYALPIVSRYTLLVVVRIIRRLVLGYKASNFPVSSLTLGHTIFTFKRCSLFCSTFGICIAPFLRLRGVGFEYNFYFKWHLYFKS